MVFIRFQSLTGQHVVNKILLARTVEGKAIGGGALVGDFRWRPVETSAEAPETAKQFSVFLGLKPAKGTVRYGGIYIATDTGASAGAPPADDFIQIYCGLQVIDLSSVKAGQYQAGEIPFEVGRAISLRCFRRPPLSLPLADILIDTKVRPCTSCMPDRFRWADRSTGAT